MSTTETTIRIPAARYEDHDDSLTAAATDYAAQHGLEGWDLEPRWEDDQRDTILLTVPVSDEQIEALRTEAGAAGDLAQVAICDRALNGHEAARAECARTILSARAME